MIYINENIVEIINSPHLFLNIDDPTLLLSSDNLKIYLNNNEGESLTLATYKGETIISETKFSRANRFEIKDTILKTIIKINNTKKEVK